MLEKMNTRVNFNDLNLSKTQRGREIIDRLGAFVEKIGYQITDCTYFRKIGPPPDVRYQCEPERGSEIFVGGLPTDAIEDEIFEFFSRVGRIFDMRLVLSDLGVYNRGYAFVRFFNPDQAKNAISCLDGEYFRSFHQVSVQRSLENNRLYVCGLPYMKTKIEVWNELIACGVCGVTDVIMYKSRNDIKKNRGFVFVEFENHQTASNVHHRYNKNETLCLFGRAVLVDWSISTTEIDKDVMAKVTRLFLRNLPVKMPRKQFVEILSNIVDTSAIEKVYKMKDYAFVHFQDRKTAELSLKKLTYYFQGTDIEITWSIPPEEVRKVEKLNTKQHKVLQTLYTSGKEKKPRKLAPQQFHNATSSLNSIVNDVSTLDASTSSLMEESPYSFPTWWDLLDIAFPKVNYNPLMLECDSDGHCSSDSFKSLVN